VAAAGEVPAGVAAAGRRTGSWRTEEQVLEQQQQQEEALPRHHSEEWLRLLRLRRGLGGHNEDPVLGWGVPEVRLSGVLPGPYSDHHHLLVDFLEDERHVLHQSKHHSLLLLHLSLLKECT